MNSILFEPNKKIITPATDPSKVDLEDWAQEPAKIIPYDGMTDILEQYYKRYSKSTKKLRKLNEETNSDNQSAIANLESDIFDDLKNFTQPQSLSLVKNLTLNISNPYDYLDGDLFIDKEGQSLSSYYKDTKPTKVLPLILALESTPLALITEHYPDVFSQTLLSELDFPKKNFALSVRSFIDSDITIRRFKSPIAAAFWNALDIRGSLAFYYDEAPYYNISFNFSGYEYLIAKVSTRETTQWVDFDAKRVTKNKIKDIDPDITNEGDVFMLVESTVEDLSKNDYTIMETPY